MKRIIILFIGLFLSFNMVAQGLANIDTHKYLIDTVVTKMIHNKEYGITVYKCIYHDEVIKEIKYIKTDDAVMYSDFVIEIEINKKYEIKIMKNDSAIKYMHKIKRRDNTYQFF